MNSNYIRLELISKLREISDRIRDIQDLNHEDRKAAQSAAQAAASLDESVLKVNMQEQTQEATTPKPE